MNPFHGPHSLKFPHQKEESEPKDSACQTLQSYPITSTDNKQTDDNAPITNFSSDLRTQRNQERIDMDSIVINIYCRSNNDEAYIRVDNDLETRNINFMWFITLIDHILELYRISNNKEDSRKDFFKVLKKHYATNDIQLKMINNFEHEYEPKKAIPWYTHNCGVYQILNKCLRNNNFDDIFAIRSFIYDLCDQLKEEHKKFVCNYRGDHPLLVYRGQGIHISELNLIERSIDTFLSHAKILSYATYFPKPE
ncbi:unnamed protein product [Rotaria sordida]|uniref:Uncharacterized protein n=1 Tax=Rotaria sordida TaxID=392033 RepID=A0A815BCW6_9BILA|nr:unnamed protein product [Rotaria sordida]